MKRNRSTRVNLSPQEFGFVVGTRAALGAGIGLLCSLSMSPTARRRLGSTLLTLGALTTLPAAYLVFGRKVPGKFRRGLFRIA